MMNSWHAYPKVYALGHAAIADIFDGLILAQEKLDGSQFSFGMIDGVLRVKSHHVEMDVEAPEKMFNIAISQVVAVQHLLTPGYTYRGEYFQKPKQNTLVYSRVPEGNIALYDINDGQESYLHYPQVVEEAKRLGFEVVRTIGVFDKAPTLEELNALLEQESQLGGTKIEGVVFKNYSRFGRDGKVFMGKFVSEKFKEANHAGNKPTSGKTIVQLLIEEYRTEARWEKAVQHLKEQGKLEGSPKDIGVLMKEAGIDLMDECGEEIKEKVWKYFKKEFARGVLKGLPEWYKLQLAKKVLDAN